MRRFHGARPRRSNKVLQWCWRASAISSRCLFSCLCFSSSLCAETQSEIIFNILQGVTWENRFLYSDPRSSAFLRTSIKYEVHLTSLSSLFSSRRLSAALRFSSSSSLSLSSSPAFIWAWKLCLPLNLDVFFNDSCFGGPKIKMVRGLLLYYRFLIHLFTHTPGFTSFLRSVTNNEGQGIKPPTHGKSEPPLEPQLLLLLQKNPRFPRKRPFNLPAFLLLSSSWVLQFPSFALLADVLGPPWLQRDGGKVSGWQAFLLCSPVIGHVHVSFLDFSFWTRTHRPKCKLLTSVTRSHLISWIKELQQCFTTSLGDGNELSVYVWTCKFPCTMSYF